MTPLKPIVQVHSKRPLLSLQVPPFLQGLGLHWLISGIKKIEYTNQLMHHLQCRFEDHKMIKNSNLTDLKTFSSSPNV